MRDLHRLNASHWQGAGLTHVGRIRRANQDAIQVVNPSALWIVADGMGGRPGGDVASAIAVRVIAETLAVAPSTSGTPATGDQQGALAVVHAIQQANMAIQQETSRRPELIGMGTTVVVLTILAGMPPRAVVGHVGDSRAYRLRKGELSCLTQDHSFVEESIRQGLLSRADAAVHPMRHVLTRAVGTERSVEPDIATHILEDDDVLLLCTDGLTKMLDERHIRTLLARHESTAEACTVLVEEANARGGEDNVSVIVIRKELTKVVPHG